jgi:hypothetical protein
LSVARDATGTIVLAGDCPVEDAEPLLQLLQEFSSSPVDWTQCKSLHTAVLQVILASRPALTGRCGDPWIAQWVL